MPGLTPYPDDLVQPFVIETTGLHGRLIRLGPALDDILTRHDYPVPVKALLGEFLSLAAALAASLKFDGVFSIQARGDGPVRTVLADVTSAGELRGYARVQGPIPGEDAVAEAPVPRLLGAGYLAFTVDQGVHADLYQGIVELQGATLIECVHHYFRQSEQFFAAVVLASGKRPSGGWRAGALMLQRLPKDDEGVGERNEIDEAWRRATILMGSCRSEELTDPEIGPNDLLYRLFHEDGVRVFPTRPLRFACRCSRERVARVLASLSHEEIAEYTVDGEIVATCQFCNTEQRFDAAELAARRAS